MKKIALIMDEWKRAFTYAWPSGILQRIRERDKDVSLYIFSSSGNWSKDEEYNSGEYNIYRLPDLKDFDGIILDLTNVSDEKEKDELVERIKNSGLPVISIDLEIDGCYYVGVNNYNATYDMIEHMHTVHNCENYWMILGPEDNYDSNMRKKGFLDYMKEHHIVISDDCIYHGSFNYDCGVEGFETLYKRHGKLPDVVLCGNDNIAVGVGEASLKRGLRIPQDLRMTGFDNFDKANIYKPNITTASYIREEIGMACADVMFSIWDGEEVEKITHIRTKPLYWESCGCGNQARIDVRKNLKERMMYDIQTSEFTNMVLLLEYDLQRCKTIQDIMNCISRFVANFKCDAMYLVMDEKIDAYKKNADVSQEYQPLSEEGFYIKGYPKRMQLKFSYENGRMFDTDSLEVEGLFPMFDVDTPGTDFLFLPLHFGNHAIGYFVIRNAVYLLEHQYLFDVMNVLTKAIENLHKKEKLEYMNSLLSKLYVHDAMTGLYNRMGYMKYGEEFIKMQHEKKQAVSVFFIDLDKLKVINDNYGHEYGDFAITAVAKTMQKYSDVNAIASRTGGDEYILLQKAQFSKLEEKLIKDIRTELEMISQKENFPVTLSVSIGHIITDPESDMTLDEYVQQADAKMYEEKIEKRANRK